MTTEERLAHLEMRLDKLERLLSLKTEDIGTNLPKGAAQAPGNFPQRLSPAASTPSSSRPPSKGSNSIASGRPFPIVNILGWTGASALVLAAAYFVRLAIDSGWLTPLAQVTLVALAGLVLIAFSLLLRSRDRKYAGLLSAGGIVVLFLALYGAHLYYHLISATLATALIVLLCLNALALGRLFDGELHALFAVVGSYSAPFLLPALRQDVGSLAIYYTAWSVLFCVYAVWIGRRYVYLLASYFALLGFDIIWKSRGGAGWINAVVFQTIQFAGFSLGAIVYSIKRRASMDDNTALAHAPALLLFYVVQYQLLHQFLPRFAPWVAIGSAVFLLGCYGLARLYLKSTSRAGSVLVAAYSSLVLLHAGYLQLLPEHFAPWAGLIAPAGLGLYIALRKQPVVVWPVWAALGIVFWIGYLRTFTNLDMTAVPGAQLLAPLYAVELYAAYHLLRKHPVFSGLHVPTLYLGHLCALVWAVHFFDNRFAVSLTWGVLALTCLGVALTRQDKLLGQSSLIIFAASALKVLIYDLAGATPGIRIACLVVVGVTFYVGGWLYRKVNALESAGAVDGADT